MIDDIKNRDSDDPVGMKSKKKKEDSKPIKQRGGFDGIIDSINDRDEDDPTGTKSKKKEKPEKQEPKKSGKGGFDGIIDSIQERDNDDPTGTKSKKKNPTKHESDDKTPLDGITKSTTDLVSAGVGAIIGIGVINGISGMLNQK